MILEHRARWCNDITVFQQKALQNTKEAFCLSFAAGNGVETDLRSCEDGSIIVCHDPFCQEGMKLAELLRIYNDYQQPGVLALNIKSAGIAQTLMAELKCHSVTNFFTFDMSIPDHLGYIKQGLNPYVRQSEYEQHPEQANALLYKEAHGVWLDQFVDPATGVCASTQLDLHSYKNEEIVSWINERVIKRHLECGKNVALVSPELHVWGRRLSDSLYKKIWQQWKLILQNLVLTHDVSKIALCTDFPIEANNFFNE